MGSRRGRQRGSIEIELRGGVQGALHCATNHTGRLRFNGGGGWWGSAVQQSAGKTFSSS